MPVYNDWESLDILLKESNEELRNYAHVVSHDLKTPLRSISAAMNWLKEDNKEILNEKYDARIQSFDDLRIEYL